MNGCEYQKMAARTMNKNNTDKQNLYHGLFGLASEVGEVLGIFQKYYQGHYVDEEHLKKELGDVIWFVNEICTAEGFSFDEIMEMNIEKLKQRYPDGFEAEKSLHRKEGDV